MYMKKHTENTITVDDVYRLSYGKRTSKRVGSRKISHRLNLYERSLLERARKSGMLFAINSVNKAALNTYFNFCTAAGRLYITLIRQKDAFILTVLPTIKKKDIKNSKFHNQNIQIQNALQKLLPEFHLSSLERMEKEFSEAEANQFVDCFLVQSLR